VTPDQVMMRRVFEQLRSRPPGWLGTAKEIAAQMDKAEPRDVEDACRVLHVQAKIRREREAGNRAPYQWGMP